MAGLIEWRLKVITSGLFIAFSFSAGKQTNIRYAKYTISIIRTERKTFPHCRILTKSNFPFPSIEANIQKKPVIHFSSMGYGVDSSGNPAIIISL